MLGQSELWVFCGAVAATAPYLCSSPVGAAQRVCWGSVNFGGFAAPQNHQSSHCPNKPFGQPQRELHTFGNMVPWLPRRRKTPKVHSAPTNPLGCPKGNFTLLEMWCRGCHGAVKHPEFTLPQQTLWVAPTGSCTLWEIWCRGCHGAVKPPEFTLPQQTLWAAPTGTAHFWKCGAVAATAP